MCVFVCVSYKCNHQVVVIDLCTIFELMKTTARMTLMLLLWCALFVKRMMHCVASQNIDWSLELS